MTRTIILSRGRRRCVLRSAGNIDPQLVDKLIQLARTRPDAARVHRLDLQHPLAREIVAAG